MSWLHYEKAQLQQVYLLVPKLSSGLYEVLCAILNVSGYE